MTLIRVHLLKDRATSLLFFSILCSTISWGSSRQHSSPFGMDGSVEPFFDVPSAGFDPTGSMYPESADALSMYPPRHSGNRSPFSGSSPSFAGNRPPFGENPSPFGNPSSSSPFGSPSSSSLFGAPDMSLPWERTMPGRGPSSPLNSRPRIGMSPFGPSPPKFNGGFTPPWERGMPSRSNRVGFPVDSSLMGMDDMGPTLGRRNRKTKADKPSLFAGPMGRMGGGGGNPEDFGMGPFGDDEGRMSFGNPFPMMELPGYEEMLMGGGGGLQGRGRGPSRFGDDMGGGYMEDAEEPSYGDPSLYGNPAAGGGGGKRGEKKRHRSRTQNKFPEEEVYTGSGMSYGPYGYQDPDFDESLIEELELVDQQSDQPETEEGGPNDQLYASMDENNLKQVNQPMRNGNLNQMVKDGDRKMKTTKKPLVQANSADALEEQVVMGNVGRRSAGETPQDVLNKIKSDAESGNGNGNMANRGPSEVINGLRSPSPPKRSKGFIRGGGGGGGRMQNNGNGYPINMRRAQIQQPQFREVGGGRRPPMSTSEEEESVIRGSLPSPGQLAPGRNLYPGLDGYVMEPQSNRDQMYPMNELTRRRRNALAENYYADTEAYPILRPLPVPITPKYLYGDQPVYTYDLPSLVFNRMKRQGGPEQFYASQRPIAGSRPGPRRVIRRIIRRRPLLQRQRRLRQQLLPQESFADDEEGSYENAGEMVVATPVVTQTNVNANNTNSTETPTTSTITTTSVPTTTTEAPHENVANPKPEATENKPVKSDHKRKRETGQSYN